MSKIKRVLALKSIFSETTYVCVCLRAKFEVSGIIKTSFRERQGGCFTPTLYPNSKQTHKTPIQIRDKRFGMFL